MSNGDTRVDVASEGSYHLGLALDLAMVYHNGPQPTRKKEATVSHWREADGKLIFSWSASANAHAFLVPHTRDMLIPLIIGWLEKQNYGNEPDMDGTVTKGWRLKSHYDLMPDIEGRFYMSFTVEPHYCEYHK